MKLCIFTHFAVTTKFAESSVGLLPGRKSKSGNLPLKNPLLYDDTNLKPFDPISRLGPQSLTNGAQRHVM